MVNDNIDAAKAYIDNLKDKVKVNLANTTGAHRKQLRGIYLGLTLSIGLLNDFKGLNIDRITQRKLQKLEEKYVSEDCTKIIKELEIDEFVYDYVAKWITRTISFIRFEIDLEEYIKSLEN